MNELVDAITGHAAPDQVAAVIDVPARSGTHGVWPEWVSDSVRSALEARGISRPWIHQQQAADLLHHGVHTVVATGTGSGKSLAAWVPALSLWSASASETAGRRIGGLRSVRYRPTVLYLSPTKALAADQFAAIADLSRSVDPRIGVAVADGDSDADSRRWAREHADIVLSNPDFAQHVMLASHARWSHLWRGLAMVVIDEFHSYRGMFGAHVAATVRRIMRIAAHYGSHPTLAFLSATSGDPAATAQRFLGDAFGEVQAVDEDSSPAGAKTLVLWRCREIELFPNASPEDRTPSDPDIELPSADAPRRAANTEAGELTGVLVERGAQTLTFVRSRPGAERVAQIARDWVAKHGGRYGGTDLVASYRGGYLPEERRELEAALREGRLRALASTNALELGIDIAGLDAVVVTGWPGTHASFAQQIGRAGRAGRDGLAVFVGRDNPLDQYLLEHPESITEAPIETNVFDPSNPYVLVPHVCAAASELALTEADARVFGLPDTGLFEELTRDGILRRRPTGWFWNPALGGSAHDGVNLRGEGSTISIVDGDSGALLGTVDSARADTTVYPGAVYLHQGVSYMVDDLIDDVALVHLHREEDIRTFADESTTIQILRTANSFDTKIGTWARGEVMVSSQVLGYDVRRTSDGMYLGRVPLSMPVRQLHTQGTWWTITQRAIKETGISASELPGALHAAEHASIGMLPLLATCDRWDVGGLSTAAHADTGYATVFVHDAIPGGSGCSIRGFEQGRKWMTTTLEMLRSCPCSSGCPRCVQSPKCGNNNEPLSKSGAAALLTLLVDAL